MGMPKSIIQKTLKVDLGLKKLKPGTYHTLPRPRKSVFPMSVRVTKTAAKIAHTWLKSRILTPFPLDKIIQPRLTLTPRIVPYGPRWSPRLALEPHKSLEALEKIFDLFLRHRSHGDPAFFSRSLRPRLQECISYRKQNFGKLKMSFLRKFYKL